MTESVVKPQSITVKSRETIEQDLLDLGNNLVTKIHVLMRISRTYDSKNVVLIQFIQESLKMINSLISKEGNLSLKIIRNDLFLNEQRLRYSVEGFTSFKYILAQWRKRNIGEVIFKEVVDEKALAAFIYSLVDLEEGREENASFLNETLAQQAIFSIRVNPLEGFEGEDGVYSLHKGDLREVAKKVFFETIGTIKEVITQIKTNQNPDVRRLKRLAQTAVHLVMQDECILLGLTAIKNYDEYTYNHSVNVCIYVLAMGRRLGFSKRTLTELGITALLHDVGKSKIPKEILNKPDKLDEEEWMWMKKHPLLGVEILLNLKQLGEINPRMVVGIFDHHLKNDTSGYPKLFRKKEVSLFGRIIQIADVYDAMTTPRIYRKVVYTPEQALAIMLRGRGDSFDPILLKVFIGVVGLFPVGSLVQLDTGQLGIVYKPNPDPKLMDHPQVLLVSRDQTGEAKKELIDLGETDSNGRFKRSIIKTLDPNKYHIDIMKYFL